MSFVIDHYPSPYSFSFDVPAISDRMHLVETVALLTEARKKSVQVGAPLSKELLEVSDASRLRAIASLLKTPQLQYLVDQILAETGADPSYSRVNARLTKENAITFPGTHSDTQTATKNDLSLDVLALKHLPGDGSFALLWADGVRFSEELEGINLRLSAHVMGLFAVRRSKVLSTLAFTLGFSISYLGLVHLAG